MVAEKKRVPPIVAVFAAAFAAVFAAVRARLSDGSRQREDESVARMARQMSSLLAGGIAPERMFELLRQDGAGAGTSAGTRTVEPAGAVRRIAELVADGVAPADALAQGNGPEWRVLAAAWQLAITGGAPLAPALARIADALAALERLHERRSVILAGPKATLMMVASLPPIALVLGMLLGFDPAPVLGSAAGAVLLTAGAVLLACGVAWGRMLQRQVAAGDHVAGLECELAWIVMRGGGDPGAAPRIVADAVDQAAAEWVPFDRFHAQAPLRRAIVQARAAGVPLAALLLEEADAERARAHAQLERDAERLGIRILIPLAVCVLPSFILVGVVPVVLSMLRS